MVQVETILLLLLAVVISGALARMTRIALPLVQIALGAAIVLITGESVALHPQLFFLLFLPPLLFLDGWRIPKEDLVRDRAFVLELALGLVIFTVLGVGLLIWWMIPAMPIGVAFALAAILSPTDPIAVAAIAKRAPIPKRLMHVLEGESLLNDASGLVCMKFAVAAVLTGAFSLASAAGTFVWLALAGVAVGVSVTLAITYAKTAVSRRWGEDTGAQIIVSLLIPFAAYLAAEHLQASGILAAVAAGVTMSFAERSGVALAVTRIRRTAVWDTVAFAANGVIFVLLGEQMPAIFSGAAAVATTTGRGDVWWLAVYVIVIFAALAALRFVWVWTSLKLTLFRQRGASGPRIGWKLVLVMSLAGVRGAITLAGILTLPLLMPDGSPFPARDLAIFLAACVIILSLTTATVLLPRVLKDLELPPEPSVLEQEDLARTVAAGAAMQAIEQTQHRIAGDPEVVDVSTEIASRLMETYRDRIRSRSGIGQNDGPERAQLEAIERQLRVAGLQAERAEIRKLAIAREIDEATSAKLIREIDLQEARYG
jgi:Na+/H+ antiporter